MAKTKKFAAKNGYGVCPKPPKRMLPKGTDPQRSPGKLTKRLPRGGTMAC
jgi:hypothetical protein